VRVNNCRRRETRNTRRRMSLVRTVRNDRRKISRLRRALPPLFGYTPFAAIVERVVSQTFVESFETDSGGGGDHGREKPGEHSPPSTTPPGVYANFAIDRRRKTTVCPHLSFTAKNVLRPMREHAACVCTPGARETLANHADDGFPINTP